MKKGVATQPHHRNANKLKEKKACQNGSTGNIVLPRSKNQPSQGTTCNMGGYRATPHHECNL
eukprot:9652028-Alexandrium_andersonii.AAC.1